MTAARGTVPRVGRALSDRAGISRNIAVIGHKGRMGAMLAQRLGAAGHRVFGADRELRADGRRVLARDELAAVLGGSAYVLLAVPVTAVSEVLELAAPYLDPGQLLFDIASVKELPLRCMEERHSGPVVGAHPLFGPRPMACELRVALVRGRGAGVEECRAVEDLFTDIGCACFWVTAEEHDRNVGLIQSLNFAGGAAYLALAERIGDRRFFTPSFRRRMESARALLTDDAAMFCDFSAMNPYFTEILAGYAETLRGIAASGGESGPRPDLVRRRLAELARQAAGIYAGDDPEKSRPADIPTD
ncbi:MAG: prephenate dehydrogenase/arogenate dehydrogenase family protein [Desulfovibrio sp.]|jgi:prephenate dehydrogenase|nr:prephenate dehydrogenase/arogenate dehydrogenase family protein [Desulfovibrio sp.]